MPPFGPIKRRELIACLHRLGFEGPYSGGKHQYMIKHDLKVRIPNPHQGEIADDLLAHFLQQAGIARITWERL